MKPPHEMTTEELKAYTYGPDWMKRFYRRFKCAAAVSDGRGTVTFSQCSRKPGHGPGGLYCKQHAKRLEVAG